MVENKCQCANCTCVKEMFTEAKEKRLGVKVVYDFIRKSVLLCICQSFRLKASGTRL